MQQKQKQPPPMRPATRIPMENESGESATNADSDLLIKIVRQRSMNGFLDNDEDDEESEGVGCNSAANLKAK